MERRQGGAKELFMRVADGLRGEIAAGVYAAGDRLPSIRALAEKYETSSVTARNGLVRLSEEGLIRADSTRGYVVTEAGGLVTETAESSSAEYGEIMSEIRGLQRQMADLAQRLVQIEEAMRPRSGA